MAIFIHNNLMARNAARILGENYAHLSASMRRLSSGLRINSAADDAAGLAIRELMRADIATYRQGIRNTNDAISLIQTADGALSIIDEKLIRMKELAEQAATGTYNATQRLIIDSEFQAMGAEIDRIARATDFNGIKLLDGSLSGTHDGSGLTSTGAMKIHFGPGNDSAEDYYYVEIGDCTLAGLRLTDGTAGGGAGAGAGNTAGGAGTGGATGNNLGNLPIITAILNYNTRVVIPYRDVSLFVIPSGTEGLSIHFEDGDENDDLQLFTSNGSHIVGTPLNSEGWRTQSYGSATVNDYINNIVISPKNGFDDNASYSDINLNGGHVITFTPGNAGNDVSYNGMRIGYSGDGNPYGSIHIGSGDPNEYLTIDKVTENLIFCAAGNGPIAITATWTTMGTGGGTTPGTTPGTPGTPATTHGGDLISIKTQDLAQKALERIDAAIVKKDSVRAHLGAMQNRLENTVSNLSIQAENLQASESRISDVDVAEEMTKYICNQILTQSATAMLAQANSLPQMLVSLIEG